MERFLKNYQELIKNPNFIKFGKNLANKLDLELSKNLKEVETVKNWIDQLNGESFTDKGLNATINSLFIHGYNHSDKGSYPSGVEFDYYSGIEKRELADIIFISSYYYGNKKILEKVTFNQAKWGEIKPTTSSWKIDKGQLYLLSRLPRFNGIKGSIISSKDYYIEDFSKCLTSYGLMNKENFIFISTNHLLTVSSGKKSVNLKDLQSLTNIKKDCNSNFSHFIDHFYYQEFSSFFNELLHNSSSCFTNNTFEFLREYLKGNIGEIIKNDFIKNKNTEAESLVTDILKNIQTFAIRRKDKEIMNFVRNYDNNFSDITPTDSNDFEDFENGLGIIQVKINLGD